MIVPKQLTGGFDMDFVNMEWNQIFATILVLVVAFICVSVIIHYLVCTIHALSCVRPPENPQSPSDNDIIS